MENVYRNNFVKRTVQLMFAPKKIRKRPPEQWIKMPTDRRVIQHLAAMREIVFEETKLRKSRHGTSFFMSFLSHSSLRKLLVQALFCRRKVKHTME